jgi:hypothetical protein
MTVSKKRCRSAGVNIGSITVALYQMLNALPRICGITGARAVSSNPWRARDALLSSSIVKGWVSFNVHLHPNCRARNPKSQVPNPKEIPVFKNPKSKSDARTRRTPKAPRNRVGVFWILHCLPAAAGRALECGGVPPLWISRRILPPLFGNWDLVLGFGIYCRASGSVHCRK